MDADTIIPFLQHLAQESSKVILPLFANPDLQIDIKSDNSPVTYADLKAEEILRTLIEKEFPDHGIIGEEHEDVRTDAEYTWILDPIDGTRSFAAGSPHFGTLICLQKNNSPIWSAINICALNQLFIGNNETAWCNQRPLRMRETPALKDCFLLTTDPKSPGELHHPDGWNNLLQSTGQYRSWGDCFGYTLLANGTADIMLDPILNLWDIAALIPVLRGAGATLSDWHGADPVGAKSLVAAHPRHHAKIIRLLNPEC